VRSDNGEIKNDVRDLNREKKGEESDIGRKSLLWGLKKCQKKGPPFWVKGKWIKNLDR